MGSSLEALVTQERVVVRFWQVSVIARLVGGKGTPVEHNE